MEQHDSSLNKLAIRLVKLAKIAEANHKSGVGAAADLRQVEKVSTELSTVNLANLETEAQRKAFWINTYNAFAIYLMVKMQIKKSVAEKPWLFFVPKIAIGGYKFTLDDIQHGILRGNKRIAHKLFLPFMPWDERRSLVCQGLDYRIHFALLTKLAAKVEFYSVKDLDFELDEAEYSFAKEYFRIDRKHHQLSVSRIYAWYRSDFEGNYLSDLDYRGYRVIFR